MYSSRSSQSMQVVVPNDHEYKVPQRAVKSPIDMTIWERSEAYAEYIGFILAINEAIKGKPLSVSCEVSNNVNNIIGVLTQLDLLIDEIKPIEQPQRFGNQAFRSWYNTVKDKVMDMLQKALPGKYHRAIAEIMVYFIDGFGNSTRIDYGTGHEISFLMFLCCLFKIGVFVQDDKLAVATRIFPRYLTVVRKLQQTYRMEPAGSHGVWSLDDYQFVPFIWGSSQLIAHPKIEPASFLAENILNDYAHDYMFLGCIEYINNVKTGLFAEHSNQLWGISGVSHWSKVNAGLIKMYKVEVLGKFPVVQHIVFGTLLPFKPVSADSAQTSRLTLSSQSSPAPTATTSSEEGKSNI